jgi:hypothetical protein
LNSSALPGESPHFARRPWNQKCSLPAGGTPLVTQSSHHTSGTEATASLGSRQAMTQGMAHSHPLTPEKSTDIHAGLDVKKKTTRVNLVIVLAVLAFFALGAVFVLKVANNPPQTPGENPIKP